MSEAVVVETTCPEIAIGSSVIGSAGFIHEIAAGLAY